MENVPITIEEKLLEKKEEKKILLDFQDQIIQFIPSAGTIELTKEQETILYPPVKEEDIEIRPDGLIYLPWTDYVTRLRKAFSMSWTIIPQGQPKVMKESEMIYWGFYLVIQGSFCGYAIGEQKYQPSNATMTYGDACEGAKSNALMRLCKGLGISLELWKPSFIKNWREKYAEQYPGKYPDGKPIKDKFGNQKLLWRKINGQEAELIENGGEQRAEVTKSEGKEEPPHSPPSFPNQATIPDYLSEVIKHIDGYKNIFELKNGFDKHKAEWRNNLTPEGFQMVIEKKNEMKNKFMESKLDAMEGK